ncbi:hypothetical protein KUTeg_021493, partial [Tegillarca granosa]
TSFQSYTRTSFQSYTRTHSKIIREPHYIVIQNPHYKVIQEPQSKVIQEPHYKVIQEPHYKVIQEPHYKVIQEPHYKVIQEPHYKVIQEPHYKVIQETHYNVILELHYKVIREPQSQIIQEPHSKTSFQSYTRTSFQNYTRASLQSYTKSSLQCYTKSSLQIKQESHSKIIQEHQSKAIQEPHYKVIQEPHYKVIQEPRSKVIQKPHSKIIQEHQSKAIQEPHYKVIQEPHYKVIQEPRSKVIQKPHSKIIQEHQSKAIKEPHYNVIQNPHYKVLPAAFLVTVGNGQPNMQDLMWFKKFLKDTGTNGTQSENYENPALFIMFTKFLKWVGKNPSVCGTNTNTKAVGVENNQGFSLDALLNSKLPAKKTSLELVNPSLVSDIQKTDQPSTKENGKEAALSSSAAPVLSKSPPPSDSQTKNPLLPQFNPDQLPQTWPQALTATPPPGTQTPTTVNPIQLPPSWEQTHTPTSPQPKTSQLPPVNPQEPAGQSPAPQSQASRPPVMVVVTTQQTLPAQLIAFSQLQQQIGPQQTLNQQQQTQPSQTLQLQQQSVGPTHAPSQQTLQTIPPSQPQQIQNPPAQTSQQVNVQNPTNPLQNMIPQLPMEKYSKEFMQYLLNSQNGNSGFPNLPQANKTQLGPSQVGPKSQTDPANPNSPGPMPSVPKLVNPLTENQAAGPVESPKVNINPALANNSLQLLQQFQTNQNNVQNLQMMQLQQNLLAQMNNQMPKSVNNLGPKQDTQDNTLFLNYLKWNVNGQNTKSQNTPVVANNGLQNNQISNNGGVRSPATNELKQQAFTNNQLQNPLQSYMSAQNLPMDMNLANVLKQNVQKTNTISTNIPGNMWMTPLQAQNNRIQAQTTIPAFQSIPDFGSTQPILTKTTRAMQGQKMTSPLMTMPWKQITVIRTNPPTTTTTTTTPAPTTRQMIKDQPLSVLEPRGHRLLSGLQSVGMISKSPNADIVGIVHTSTVSPLIHGYTTQSYNFQNQNLGNFNNGNKNFQNFNQNNGGNFGHSSTGQFQDMSRKNTGINQGHSGNNVGYNDFVSLVANALLEISKQGGNNQNAPVGPNNNFNNQYRTTLPPPNGYTAGFDPWSTPYPTTIPPPPGHTMGNAFDPWNQKPTTSGFFPEVDIYGTMNPSLDYAVHHPNGKNWREMNEKTGDIQLLRNEVTGAEVYVDTSPALGKGVFVIIGTKCWIGVNAQNPDFVLGIRNVTRKAQTLPTILANPLVINAIEQEEVKRPTFTRISPTLMEFCEGKQAFLVKPISGQGNMKKQCIQLAVAKYCIIARPQPISRTATRPRSRPPRPGPAPNRPPP